MIIVDDDKIEKRLNSEKNLALRLGKGNRINHENSGRNEGDKNLHPVLRSIISAAAQLDTAKNVSNNFNISPSHAHNLKHGRTIPNGPINPEILNGKRKVLDNVRDKAIDILNESLGLIPEKIKDSKLKVTQVSQVAKDMAHIIDKTTPNKERDLGPKVIIITAPIRQIETYETIEVGIEDNH